MISAATITAQYRRVLDETIIVRRYTGSGASRIKFDAAAVGKETRYAVDELVGSIIQGDHRVIVLVEDLIGKNFALPVTTNDKIVVSGRELAIIVPNERKAPDGTLVAYDLQCRG